MNKLVSGIFLGLYRTDKGGRPNAWKERYYSGVAHLKDNSFQKVIYITPGLKDELERFLTKECSKEQLDRYTLKPFDLNNIKYHGDITRVRETVGGTPQPDRCIHVQWGKFEFLANEAQDANNVFWIDAGLISNVLFPKRIYPDRASEVVSDKFLSDVMNKTGDKFYVMTGDRRAGFTGPGSKTRRYHPIGGFFGGSKSAINETVSYYDSILNKYINDNQIVFEEVVMEDDFHDRPDGYTHDSFDSWYHEDGMIKAYANIKNKKFYHLLTNI